jgi:hypothetical protein
MVANSYKPGSIESAMQSPATTETPELKNGEYWIAKIRTLMLEYNIESSTEMEKFFNDFKDNDTPAASLHHNNFKWGLWEHLYNVARYMLKWNKDDALGYNNASCLKVALLHDADKFVFPCIPDVLKSGKPAKKPWKHTEKQIYIPHEFHCLMIALEYFALDGLEQQAIIYHHGPFSYDIHVHAEKMTKFSWLLHTSDHYCASLIEESRGAKESEEGE